MEKVITVEVNLNLKADQSLIGLIGTIAAIANGSTVQPEQPAVDPDPQPAVEQPAETEAKPKRTRSKKTDPTPATDPQPAETEQPAADPEPEPQPDQQPAESVSLEEVKQVFFQKLAGHRDEIRSKINELGAPSLSTIEAAKLPEMLKFLKSLD